MFFKTVDGLVSNGTQTYAKTRFRVNYTLDGLNFFNNAGLFSLKINNN
jgi:hypothetical protein